MRTTIKIRKIFSLTVISLIFIMLTVFMFVSKSFADDSTENADNVPNFYYSDSSELNEKFGVTEESYSLNSEENELSTLNLDGWNAGNIMSDAMMSNYKSMDAGSIQAFLRSKVPSCDTMGTKPGHTPKYGAPYTCLVDYSEGGASAAQIIWNISQQYKINPQVLIVLLQKEQGLITDDWPTTGQYRTATGYGCPDSAACDSQYYGLTNQLAHSAALFRTVLDGGWSTYPVGPNSILWNPNRGCGASDVYVENRATSSLYRYTPYQPNGAALAAGYGTGDGCSSYGNRNFYNYFRDWFGDTRVGGFWPEGHIEAVSSDSNGNVTVSGWALDRDNWNASIDVHLYIGVPVGVYSGQVVVAHANLPRQDVNDVKGGPGNHGFKVTFNVGLRGTGIPINSYGINIGSGGNNYLNTMNVDIIDSSGKTPLYRAAKLNGAGYFYTANYSEYLTVQYNGMRPEGIAYYVSLNPQPGFQPVYRAAHLSNGGYFYTMNLAEYNTTPSYGYRKEGVAFYASPSPASGTRPVYRAAKFIGGYFYTQNVPEYNTVPNFGMRKEGLAWYAY
jgi:hypothetical protein